MATIILVFVSTVLALVAVTEARSQSPADCVLSGRLDGLAAGLMITKQVSGRDRGGGGGR